MVYWITGLAGAGKTTIAKKVFELLRQHFSNAVYLDGDILRVVFGADLDYSQPQRRESAWRNARLCNLLANQEIHVVCSTISMFHEVRRWNRSNIPGYCEIFLDVPMEVLQARDQKGLYSGVKQGAQSDVTGIDLPAELPENPDLTVLNDGRETPVELAVRIYSRFKPSASA